MKILITTYGTLGDVLPYVALGKGLLHAGHQVVLGTSERFRDFVEGHGLAFGHMHHGGAGTVAAGLRSGRPSVIVPFFGDQPFWGRLVHSLGAGTKPIPRKKLTAGRLAVAISEAISNPDLQKRAEEIGKKIRQEDGVDNAVDVIEKIMKDT